MVKVRFGHKALIQFQKVNWALYEEWNLSYTKTVYQPTQDIGLPAIHKNENRNQNEMKNTDGQFFIMLNHSQFIVQHSKSTICGLEKSDSALDELNRVYSNSSD